MGILEVQNVNKHFGGLHALNNVNLSVEEGTVHAIIGPNGAGKSTFLNCLIGKLAPDTGSVMFQGTPVLGKKPHEINQLGISRVFQTPEIFSDLTVYENVMIPCLAHRDGSFRLNALKRVNRETDIREQAEKVGADLVLTTQKDWTKVISDSESTLPFAYLAIEIKFLAGEDKLTALISDTLAGRISA